jgi:hypothetical protein
MKDAFGGYSVLDIGIFGQAAGHKNTSTRIGMRCVGGIFRQADGEIVPLCGIHRCLISFKINYLAKYMQ